MRTVDPVASVSNGSGNPVQLGSELGRGGEGAVFEVVSNPSAVAKIYHQPLSPQHIDKLRAMISSSTPELLKFSAWPLDTLCRNGRAVGFLMPRVGQASRPVHELYTPKNRLREFPAAHWDFLIHVASNVARSFAAIHKAGHVIGDVNHGNALVSSAGIAAFIDCDSFQVKSNGRVFLCEVGVDTYTPPELARLKSFAGVERTQNHDAFGLAVLIFHLLFMGRHPFAGRFAGFGDMPIERAIAECRFPFGRLARQMQMSPPPNSLLLSQVPTALADAFERAFAPEAAKGGLRPMAVEWISVLAAAQKELTRCVTNKAHLYFARLRACPWCEIESHGIILFIEVGVTFTDTSSIDQLWARFAAPPVLGPLPVVPAASAFSLTPSPEYRASGRSRRIRIGSGVAAVIVSVWIAFMFNSQIPDPWPVLLVMASVGCAFLLPRASSRRRTAASKVVQEQRLKYQQLQNRYTSECEDQPFSARTKSLNDLHAEYRGLPLQRQRKIQDLEKQKLQLQLVRFLDQFSVNSATIPGIGSSRKQMLISFGIDSAADVTPRALERVPGIGYKLGLKITAWRSSLERRFRFDPKKAIDRLDVEKVDREIRARKLELEKLISQGIQDAVATHGQGSLDQPFSQGDYMRNQMAAELATQGNQVSSRLQQPMNIPIVAVDANQPIRIFLLDPLTVSGKTTRNPTPTSQLPSEHAASEQGQPSDQSMATAQSAYIEALEAQLAEMKAAAGKSSNDHQ